MKTLILVLIALLATSTLAKAENGEAIFDQSCGNCHFKQRNPAKRDEMVAPPIDMMAAHIKMVTGGDRAAFVARVVSYIKAPDPTKTVDPMALERFGLMPAIGDTFPELSDQQLQTVAGWVFDTFGNARLPPMDQRGWMMMGR